MLRDDTVPSVLQQTPWKCGLFDFGKAKQPHIDYFNPTLVERKDGLWLIARRSIFEDRLRFGKNDCIAFKLGGSDGMTPEVGFRVKFTNQQEGEQHEDPRALYHDGQTWVSSCSFVWSGKTWTGAHQQISKVNESWLGTQRFDPIYGKNGPFLGNDMKGHEKNWLWFFHRDQLHLVYESDPMRVVQFNENMGIVDQFVAKPRFPLPWEWGTIRGGTNPVKVDDMYWSFFHSSMEWQPPYRRYFMGAYAFSTRPPFYMRMITPQPLLIGSQADKWFDRKPLVVFPCGALFRDGKWLVSFGVNDLQSAWMEIPHDELRKKMRGLEMPASASGKVPV